MDKLRRAFDYFDRDRSGNINTAELAAVLAHIGKPQRPEHMPGIVNILIHSVHQKISPFFKGHNA
jgi:Ca2+-binding EF-hand superfamily protein